MYFYYYNKFRPLTFYLLYGLWQAHTISNSITLMAAKRVLGPQGKRKLGSPPPILQIMILKLSPPRCVISKESVQQKWIDKLWFRKQLSTCLFVMGPGSLHRLTPAPLSVGLITLTYVCSTFWCLRVWSTTGTTTGTSRIAITITRICTSGGSPTFALICYL
jgi:hypothetical protein